MSNARPKIMRLEKTLSHQEADRVPAGEFFWTGFIHRSRAKWGVDFDPYFEPAQIKYRLTEDKDWTIQAVTETWGFDEEIRHFVGAIKGEHKLSCTVEDGVRCMEIICSVYPNHKNMEESS